MKLMEKVKRYFDRLSKLYFSFDVQPTISNIEQFIIWLLQFILGLIQTFLLLLLNRVHVIGPIFQGISSTGCGSHFENPTNFKILKEPL